MGGYNKSSGDLNSMDPILSVPSIGPPTIDELQAQMSRYSQLASDLSSRASADYKALKAAVNSGNAPDALSALAQLQRDSNAPESTSAAPSSASSKAHLSVGAQPSNAQSLDATA
jgi:hypothetical protein